MTQAEIIAKLKELRSGLDLTKMNTTQAYISIGRFIVLIDMLENVPPNESDLDIKD